MKKLILFCTILFLLTSCDKTRVNTVSDIQKIKEGMTENEVKYLLGEPKDIEIENGYKELEFLYETESYRHRFNVYIVNGKVNNFETY